MKVKDLVISKIELGYDLYEKYENVNPFNNGKLNEELESFFSNEFFEDVLDECEDEEEKIEQIKLSLEQFHHLNIKIDNEILFYLYDSFMDNKETEHNMNDIRITREEYESCEDIKEFETMMEYVSKFNLMSIGANIVADRY